MKGHFLSSVQSKEYLLSNQRHLNKDKDHPEIRGTVFPLPFPENRSKR